MMTETQRSAMQAAEDAFRRESDYYAMIGKETKARANMALAGQMAAALAEPEQADAPVGWLYTSVKSLRKKFIWHRDDLPDALRELDPVPLYTRPQRREPQCRWPTCHSEEYQQQLASDVASELVGDQRREPLTDEQIDYIYNEHCGDGGPTAICERFARAIEAAHQIGANP